jgi:hemoglobin
VDRRTLFERIGGEAAVIAAVDRFYEKVLADPLTRPFFEGLDIAAQTRKQMSFMVRAFDGPDHYKGRDLRAAHAPLVAKGLGDAQFDAVASHLRASLQELDVEGEVVDEVLTLVGGMRSQVLGR